MGANLRPGPRSSERRARGWLPGQRIPRPAGTLAGAPPPWSRLPEDHRRSISVDEVRQALASSPGGAGRGRARASQAAGHPGRAARRERTPGRRQCFACCSRTTEKPTSCSPAARRTCALTAARCLFPGGACSPVSHPFTPLCGRPTRKLASTPAPSRSSAQLTPLTTVRSPALVHCFVGYFRTVGPESLAFAFDPGEVEKVFWVPLAGLAVEGIYHEELWPAPENDGGTVFRAVPFFRLEDDVVWGATGRLLTELIGAVLARRTTPQPEGRSWLSGRYPGGT